MCRTPEVFVSDQGLLGEAMEIVAQVLPVPPSRSSLPWSVENLRFCNWCDQLTQKDLNDCPHCGRRMAALPR